MPRTDNQTAVMECWKHRPTWRSSLGGYNSSNTRIWLNLCEEKLPTYFISSEEKIFSQKEILHYNFHTKEELLNAGLFARKTPVRMLVTSGASCPDALVEAVIRKLAGLCR